MGTLNVNTFKAKLTGGGARPNLFRVIVNFPQYADGDTELTSFMCKAASLPASTVAKMVVPYRGREIPLPGDRTFEPWTIRIINDTNFAVRDPMVEWMNGYNDLASNTAKADPSQWYADLVVEQLDKNENVVKTYKIRDAFPTTVGNIELSNDTTNTIEEFDVIFDYLYWE